MNTQNHISRVLVVTAFAIVAIAATFANSGQSRELAQPEFIPAVPAPTPPAKTAVAAKDQGTMVGTCNTVKGCKRLKEACKSLKKHTYKSTSADGSLGVCTSFDPATATFYLRNSNSPGTPVADVGLTAPQRNSAATLYCHGTVFCRKVKNICAALGGDYQPIYDTSGACNY